MTTKLSPHQIAQTVFDDASSSIKTTLQNLEIGIELSADDGDSVESRQPTLSSKVSVISGTVSGTILISDSMKYFSEILVVTYVTENITATSLKAVIEVSPSDTGNIWLPLVSLDCTVKSTTIDPATIVSKLDMPPYRRIRAKLSHSAYTAGSFELVVNGR
jgi:hypothetical protein